MLSRAASRAVSWANHELVNIYVNIRIPARFFWPIFRPFWGDLYWQERGNVSLTSRLKDVPKRSWAHVSTLVFSSTRFWVTRTSGISSLIFFISGFAVFVCTCFCVFSNFGDMYLLFFQVCCGLFICWVSKTSQLFRLLVLSSPRFFWFSVFWCSVLDIIRVYILWI